jgi:CRISPR-associated protein Csd1
LVSFNKDKTAFSSFEKLQNLNAPVSKRAAFQYATALNHLLRAGSRQRLVIGDSTTVFWSEEASPAEDLFAYLLDPAQSASESANSELDDHLRVLLSQIAQGAKPSELGEPNARFYILGLAPNAARLAVRFWHVATLGELLDNIGDHFANLQIPRGPRDPEFPAIWQLLRETARETKDVSPLLGGALTRAVLTRAPYPRALPLAVLNRIRADRRVNATRAAILKAFLIRNHKLPMNIELQRDHPELSYHLSRLFAVFEQSQRQAHEFKLERTIQDTFLSSASATPAMVFPRLHRLHIHHLRKLSPGSRKFFEDHIQAIEQRLTRSPTAYPSSLSLRQQGIFFIGYYQQMYELKQKRLERAEPQNSDKNTQPESTI